MFLYPKRSIASRWRESLQTLLTKLEEDVKNKQTRERELVKEVGDKKSRVEELKKEVDVLETAALEVARENPEVTTSSAPTDQSTEVLVVQNVDPPAPSNQIDPYQEPGTPVV
uniref:Uncharacterized protein n=1 Tax=Cannabis sativa TaxID=3483 RepID=A0A803Q7W4_CANSA